MSVPAVIPLPWGSAPRIFAARGWLEDAFGSFRMVAAECAACRLQLVASLGPRKHPHCRHCGRPAKVIIP